MRKKSSNTPVIIIGMHRSGTTMITKFIDELGVFLGSKKNRGPNFESYFFMNINKWIIKQRGGRWDFPENLKFENDIQTDLIYKNVIKILSSFKTREYFGGKFGIYYRNLLENNFSFGWKDPRTSLLLDFWKNIYPNAKVIHIYRNPIDVSKSLAVREMDLLKKYQSTFRNRFKELILSERAIYNQSNRLIDINEGVKVWNHYVTCCLNSEYHFQNVLHIKYEYFLKNPKEVLNQISDFINIIPNENLVTKMVSKVDVSRRYSFLSDQELINKYNEIKNLSICKKLGYNKII